MQPELQRDRRDLNLTAQLGQPQQMQHPSLGGVLLGNAYNVATAINVPARFERNYFVISVTATIAATPPIIGDGQWRTRHNLGSVSQDRRIVVARAGSVISRGSYNGGRRRNNRGRSVTVSVTICARRDVRRYSIARCRGHVHRPPCNIDPARGDIDGLSVSTYNTHRSECHHSEGKRSVTHPTHSERETSPCSNDTEWMYIGNSAGEADLVVSGCGKGLRVYSVSSNLAVSFSAVNHFLKIIFAILGREEST